ncbi:hypothetical protein FNV43_RR19921 [Rhamnella rubrinervis]|uniref:Uncharacterized protein n=1 Tax=Rhamnella rubrinervis TaxID=2594499 RepID=A0A8K0DXR7_9ROSA|nr:hypothetical protein FNV43_RR19921 [Rhamnella rubrinervis]
MPPRPPASEILSYHFGRRFGSSGVHSRFASGRQPGDAHYRVIRNSEIYATRTPCDSTYAANLLHIAGGGSPGLQIKMGESLLYVSKDSARFSHLREEIRPWTLLSKMRFLLPESNGGGVFRFLYPYALQNVNRFANYRFRK